MPVQFWQTLGARVIKIEPPSGDPMRNMGRAPKIDSPLKTFDFQFDVDNRGKESLGRGSDATRRHRNRSAFMQQSPDFLCAICSLNGSKNTT